MNVLTILLILIHRSNIRIMHIVQGNHILHDRIHKPNRPLKIKNIKQQTIKLNHSTRHTYYISDQCNNLIIPWNKHQEGNVDSNPSSDDKDKDSGKDSEAFTSPRSIANEVLLSAFIRFRRPDQVLLSDVHTVLPGETTSHSTHNV